jgi:hypothetical protein
VSVAPIVTASAVSTYSAGWRGMPAPMAIDAAIVPGPVVSGKVIGKKLRLTTSARGSSPICERFTATRTSSSSLRLSMRQADVATSSPPPMRTIGSEMPNRSST